MEPPTAGFTRVWWYGADTAPLMRPSTADGVTSDMWSSTGKDLESSPEIWNDETGETVAEAFARFSTFGPVMNVAEAIRYLKANPTVDMMSFGYGDDPEDFDSVEVEALIEAVDMDGVSEVNDYWGPFAPWVN